MYISYRFKNTLFFNFLGNFPNRKNKKYTEYHQNIDELLASEAFLLYISFK